jgi:hypothetical protein
MLMLNLKLNLKYETCLVKLLHFSRFAYIITTLTKCKSKSINIM